MFKATGTPASGVSPGELGKKKRKKAFNTAQFEHLLLQPFDSVPVSALSSAQRPFDIPKARPQPLRLPLGLLALPHQTLAQTVRLLHLSQLCLLMKHTHTREDNQM